MTAAYDALLASDTPDFRVLVDVQPMEVLNVWTAAGGGFTNTYYASYLTQIATAFIPGGIYRRLDFVRQNATDYTARASIALVDANAGSYFHDTSTNRIYVHTTTSVSPENFALIGVWFTLFFSTGSVAFTDGPANYWPIVTGQLPALTSEMPDPLFGATVSEAGAVSLLNGDGLFDRLSQQYVWRNKLVVFKLGGASLPYSDFTNVITMRINGFDVDDEYATLQLESMGSVFNRSLPRKTWGDGTVVGDVAEEGALSLSQPILFGTVEDCPLTLIDNTVSFGKYGVIEASPAHQALVNAVYAIDRVTRVRTLLTVTTHYTVGGSGYTVTIVSSTYTADLYEIRADLTDVGSTGTFGGFAQQLLIYAGIPASDIDTGAFSSIGSVAPVGLYLTVSTPIADLLRTLEQSCLAQIYQNVAGQWTCRLFDPSVPAQNLSDADFVTWQPTGDLQAVLNEVRVRYAHNPATDDWSEASASDDTILYGNETSDSHRIDTFLMRSADASYLAGHYRFLKSRPASRIHFEERGLSLIGARPGDRIAITRDRGPIARTGRLDGQLFLLTSLTKALGPETPTVRGILSDMEGQADRIFRFVASGSTLTWATATAAEKALYGFLADANRYVDATDPLTKDGKVLW